MNGSLNALIHSQPFADASGAASASSIERPQGPKKKRVHRGRGKGKLGSMSPDEHLKHAQSFMAKGDHKSARQHAFAAVRSIDRAVNATSVAKTGRAINLSPGSPTPAPAVSAQTPSPSPARPSGTMKLAMALKARRKAPPGGTTAMPMTEGC